MIGRLYRWLFDAHRHGWETIKSEPYTRFQYWKGEKIDTGAGTLHTLRCKTCGAIKGVSIGVGGE